ncbi:hypothetical protein RMS29_022705 [Agrobacterium rosae]|uniref:Uncharacterized protein n=1 Tax=Agrobacterium rosae TaxID=1972867 RepID=A0ABU4VZ77_9HYPH|nr:hypothetical protein [Agrobacterium rosae]MDX8315162.1 hypothetical protein [Agrobacterium rosae]MDX8330820.1 hypothetical protein [Agrobacterium rosae]
MFDRTISKFGCGDATVLVACQRRDTPFAIRFGDDIRIRIVGIRLAIARAVKHHQQFAVVALDVVR